MLGVMMLQPIKQLFGYIYFVAYCNALCDLLITFALHSVNLKSEHFAAQPNTLAQPTKDAHTLIQHFLEQCKPYMLLRLIVPVSYGYCLCHDPHFVLPAASLKSAKYACPSPQPPTWLG